MEINNIDAIAQNIFEPLQTQTASGKAPVAGDFQSWMENELKTTNENIHNADMALRQYALGESDNLHQVMMSLSKAKTSFELVVEVRNRLLEGYQEILRMQI